MRQTVIGFFDSSTEAQNAVQRLADNGFTIDQVDITYNDRSVLENQVTDSTTSDDTLTTHRNDDDGFGEKVSRFFKSLFDDDDERRKYESVARNAAIVTVLTDSYDKAQSASEIMDDCGAVDIDEHYSQYENQNYMDRSSTAMDISSTTDDSLTNESLTSDNTRNRRTDNLDTDDDLSNRAEKSIPIVEERLQVGKREVDKGSVRVRSRIIERPVEESVRLREERVRIDRNPVNRPATEGDLSTFREGEIEIKQRAEVPVVNKEARVVEEVNLNRDVTEREEIIRDTVRRTEVDIDETVSDDDDLRTSRTKRTDSVD